MKCNFDTVHVFGLWIQTHENISGVLILQTTSKSVKSDEDEVKDVWWPLNDAVVSSQPPPAELTVVSQTHMLEVFPFTAIEVINLKSYNIKSYYTLVLLIAKLDYDHSWIIIWRQITTIITWYG